MDEIQVLAEIKQEYKYGFRDPEKYVFKARKGLDHEIIDIISDMKGEPDWMRQFRHRALDLFLAKPMPTWGGDLSGINFDDIYYYIKPAEKQGKSWDDVPADIKNTFDRLGIPEAERKFLAGVGAQYECLSADTQVATSRGPVPICEIEPGDTVFAFDEMAERLIPAPVKGKAYKGEREVFEVRVHNRTIRATANHPFLTLTYKRAEGRQRGRYTREWKYLRDLKPGDLVAVAKQLPDVGQPYALEQPQVKAKVTGRNQFGSEYELDITQRYNPVTLPTNTSPDLMWWLGLYLGDGFIHHQKDADKARVEFAIPATDVALRSELERTTQSLFGVTPVSSDPDRLTIYSTIIAQFIEANGLAGTAHTKQVPSWVYSLPIEQRLAFLGGFVDADGYVRDYPTNHDVSLTSTNQALLQQMQILAHSCGITTSSIAHFQSKHPFDPTRVVDGYRMQLSGDFERIGCRSPQRLARLGKRRYHHDFSSAKGTTFRSHVNEFIGFARIESITPAGTEPVYDIEVDGPHNFVAQGLIVHNSEVVYHSLKEEWEKLGVIFLDTDTALREHPDLFREYFGTVIPPADNKFAALNSAVWSGGSFIYVPKGVKLDIPLQAYFRINAQNMGQFERTLIIVDEGASAHYVEGCTAPIYASDSLHSAVVEIIVKAGGRCRYTTIQNWSNNVYNLVTKRAVAYEDALMEWIDGNLGCLTGDTEVLLNSDIKPISEVAPGDVVYSLDANLQLVRSPVVAKRYSGQQQVFRLRTENHREIRATANHPFLALVKQGKSFALAWKRLDELSVDDWIAIVGDVPDHDHFGDEQYDRPVHFSRVVEITPLGMEDTWDLEIANSHNFVANGLIVHNSKLTMKYPAVYMLGKGARAEILSIAFAGRGQHQDAGGKVVHGAPYTSSRIISKSISKDGGRASYRGLLKVAEGAVGSKANVVCDALILDEASRSDTYPYIEIDEDDVTIGHEATVSKIGDEQLFYLMSRGLSEEEAATMIVSGFIEPMIKELPMEYAVEMNRLIQLQMEGSVG